jgi:CSLREA domain-containing protein
VATHDAATWRSLGRMEVIGKRLVLAALLALGVLAPATPALASTLTVTTRADELTNNGNCSLREAIRAASMNVAVDACGAGSSTTADLIDLPAGLYQLSRADAEPPVDPYPPLDEDAGMTGDLDIRGGVTIRGAGESTTIVDGGQLNRVIQVFAGANVTLDGVTIRNGLSHLAQHGGGIANAGSLVIVRSTVSGNSTTHDDPLRCCAEIILPGGGIENTGTLSLIDSTVSGNGTRGPGGGIASSGTLHITRGTIRGNGAGCFIGDENNCLGGGNGGGLSNTGSADIADSSIDANTGNGAGGGISNGGLMSIVNSTISGDTAAADSEAVGVGGGIFNADTGILTVSNSTISGNGAEGFDPSSGRGGGIFNAGSLRLVSSTMTGNGAASEAAGGAGVFNAAVSPKQASLLMSILAGNGSQIGNGPDCAGQPLMSEGSNLIGSAAGCSIGGVTTGNLIGVDPGLGPLQDNAGPTFTHALLARSPAIDAVKTDACPATDQRGVVRPQDGNLDGRPVCDIGAFELRRAGTPPPNAVPPAGAAHAPIDARETPTPPNQDVEAAADPD